MVGSTCIRKVTTGEGMGSSSTRAELLAAARHIATADGLAPPLTGISMADVAARAGMSTASVSRAVRTKRRLGSRVPELAAHQRSTDHQAVQLWSVMRQRQSAESLEEGAHAAMETSRRMQEAQDAAIPLPGLWGFVTEPGVRDQIAASHRFLYKVFITSIGSWMQERGRTVRQPFTMWGLVAGTTSFATGAMALRDVLHLEGGVDRTLLDFGAAITTEGRLVDQLAPVDLPAQPAPPLLAGPERQVVDAALSIVVERGLPGPLDHVTVRRLTAATDSSAGAVYREWESIEHVRTDALAFIFGEALGQARAAAGDGAGPTAVLNGWLRALNGAPLLLRSIATESTAQLTSVRSAVDRLLDVLDRVVGLDRVGRARLAAELVCLAVGSDVIARVDPSLVDWSGGERPNQPLLHAAGRALRRGAFP